LDKVNNLNTARKGLTGVGADNTSALALVVIMDQLQQTEQWNGTAWTEVNDLNTARSGLAGAGIVPAALAFGGFDTAASAGTESWNGTSWTEENDLNTARNNISGTGTLYISFSIWWISSSRFTYYYRKNRRMEWYKLV
jgi:hypothetical protein